MIKVEHLTKCYGSFKAVDDLSFEIDDGHVYGFLGPNGAGKSTTMNIMTGCLSATEGCVSIDGHDILEDPKAAKQLIGYLPEIPPLYVSETPLEYLRFVAEAKGLKGSKLQSEISRVIEETGLEAMRSRLISSLSKGYRQRVGIAQALLGDPKLIILDEPTVGLDPIQIIEIRDLIRKLGESHTVIFSSHILSEVQAICDKVMIISHGRLVAYDSTDNLENVMTGQGEIKLKVRADREASQAVLRANAHVSKFTVDTAADNDGLSIIIETDGSPLNDISSDLVLSFAAKGLPVYEISSHRANLEEIFLELTGTDTAEAGGAVQSDTADAAAADSTSTQDVSSPAAESESSVSGSETLASAEAASADSEAKASGSTESEVQ